MRAQENVAGANGERALPARRLSEPGVAACALRDLCEARAAALGVDVDPVAGYDGENPEDMPPLERLQLVSPAGCLNQHHRGTDKAPLRIFRKTCERMRPVW